MIASDRLFEPFNDVTRPTRTATPGAGIRLGRSGAGQPRRLRARGSQRPRQADRARVPGDLERLLDLADRRDVRGEGFFYGIELVKDKATKEVLDDELSEWLLRSFLSVELFEPGCTAAPTTAVTRWCSWPAADQRPGSVRRDRVDPAPGVHPGMDHLQTRGDAWH